MSTPTATEPPCCPHCGGKSGYVTKIQYKAMRLTGWDLRDVDTDSFQVISETDARCEDCGAPVRAFLKKLKRAAR